MDKSLTILALLLSCNCFCQNQNAESKFRNIQSQFVYSIGGDNCEKYIQDINDLSAEITGSLNERRNESLKELREEVDAFEKFVSTLSGCGSSGSQVPLKYFYNFLKELNLSPNLISKKPYGEIYSLKIGNFDTFYVINDGPGKTYSIKIEANKRQLKSSLGTHCKVARGFFQGKQISSILHLEFTYQSISDECWEF